jgi:environmental stress-induced protein Ves
MTTRIGFTELTETRWANGAGRKADITSGDGWTLAFAWLDGPAAFSDYTGFNRTITLVEGDGFVLDGADRALTIDKIGQPAHFDGGWRVQCRLLGGPCFVLNAYSAQGRWRQTVRVVEPRGAGPLKAGDFVVVLRGQVWVGGVSGGPRDCLCVSGPAAASGSADALVAIVRFDPGR